MSQLSEIEKTNPTEVSSTNNRANIRISAPPQKNKRNLCFLKSAWCDQIQIYKTVL